MLTKREDAMQVTNCVIPVFIREPESATYVGERLKMLMETLAKNWKGANSLEVNIIVNEPYADSLNKFIPINSNIILTVISDRSVLGTSYSFCENLDWWRRELVTTLFAVAGSRSLGVLVLNAGTICINNFDETTFIDQGRLISQWEPRTGQPWWKATEDLLQLHNLNMQYGLSAPPNVLSSKLMQSMISFVSSHLGDVSTVLRLAPRIVTTADVVWTDMSLYTTVAASDGSIFNTHLEPDFVFDRDLQVRSTHSVWRHEDLERSLMLLDCDKPDAIFVYITPDPKIPVSRLKKHFGS